MTSAKTIWVPAEATDGPLLVADYGSDALYPVTKGIGEMVYEQKGRERRVKAAPGELVQVEEGRSGKRVALVTIEGGHTVRVLVLGDWHERGEKRAPTDAPASIHPACARD